MANKGKNRRTVKDEPMNTMGKSGGKFKSQSTTKRNAAKIGFGDFLKIKKKRQGFDKRIIRGMGNRFGKTETGKIRGENKKMRRENFDNRPIHVGADRKSVD